MLHAIFAATWLVQASSFPLTVADGGIRNDWHISMIATDMYNVQYVALANKRYVSKHGELVVPLLTTQSSSNASRMCINIGTRTFKYIESDP